MAARRRLRLLVAALAVTAGTATACTDANGTDGKDYVTGDGAVIEIAPSDRGEPVELSRRDARRRPARPRRPPRQGRRGQRLGAVVPAVPQEAPLLVDAGRRAARRRHRPRASTSATPARTTRWPSSAGSASTYPSIYDPGQRAAPATSRRRSTRATCPARSCSTAEGRVAALIRGEIPSQAHAARRRRGGGGRGRADRWVTGSATPRSPARWCSRSRSRSLAGLVSFFSPCVIPLLPGYLSYATGLSGADLADSEADAAPRPDARRLAAVRARLLGRLRRPGRAVGEREPLVLRELADRSRSCSACSPSCSGWPSWGWCRCSSATSASTRCPPSGWPRRRCSASCSASAGRRASARRSAVILGLATYEDAEPRRASCSAFYSLGLGLPFILAGAGLAPRARRVRVGAPAPAVGDPGRRR